MGAAGSPALSDGEEDLSDQEILALLGLTEEEEEPTKPFGNQIITEDEAVDMDRK
jgi:DNA repair protein RadC